MSTFISRKTFVQQTLLASAGVIISGPLSATSESGKRLKKIGLILNVLQKEMQSDWEGTLRKVAAMGYRQLEFGNYYGESLQSFKKFLDEVGLQPIAGGAAMAQLKKSDVLKKMIDDSLYMGKQYLVCYWPWMDSGNNKTLDDFKRASDDLNVIGEQCTKAGIRFAMHNHDKEFVPVQGYQWGYQVMLEQTDPAKVAMLLDLYWVTKGGGDPVSLLRNYPKRFELFHVKDMDKTSEQLYTCPGYGVIDFKKIFAVAKQSNVKHFIVEIDQAENPMTCVQDSFTFLKNLRY
jgi:sugar phosphate isomerase/epimerase